MTAIYVGLGLILPLYAAVYLSATVKRRKLRVVVTSLSTAALLLAAYFASPLLSVIW